MGEKEDIAELTRRIEALERKVVQEIWLKATGLRMEGQALKMQVEGDRGDRPTWWDVNVANCGGQTTATDLYRTLADGLDSKSKLVTVRIAPDTDPKEKGCWKIMSYRIQQPEPTR